MTTTAITQEEIDAVFPTVADTMADALGCDVEDIKPNVSLIEDLDAESIDFLDMVFRLERAFKIKIPRGKIVENARGTLTEAEFEQKGVVTDVGMAQLKAYLSEVPAERFKSPMKVADIPRLFTPETFCKLVVQAQRDAKAAAERRLPAWMSDHFAAFSFVDRITGLEPGDARARHVRDSGATSTAFPSCLMAEAVGQLAAWVAMAHIGFRGRPVAALAQRDAASARRRRPGDSARPRGRDRETATTRPWPTRGTGRHRRRARDRARRLPRTDAAARRFRRSARRWRRASRC